MLLCDQLDQLEYEANEGRLFGRGSRSRKTVDYSEMLTEREWLKVLSAYDCSISQYSYMYMQPDPESICICVLFLTGVVFLHGLLLSDQEL